ncbi:MAG: multicopper oxidase domain-containing protein [Hyphomicrobiales bacterium]|nr:multicopper oxidase domain-containing protein [Hyphomicrobiales bacterium]MDE2116179.1 multicopper oxidase domain-containing protein [Hyphomicrobiales bacterium]
MTDKLKSTISRRAVIAALGGVAAISAARVHAQGMGGKGMGGMNMGGMNMGGMNMGDMRGDSEPATIASGTDYSRALIVPAQLTGTPAADGSLRYDLEIGTAKAELLPGLVTPVLAYNGSVPGPTLRAPRGKKLHVHITNHLEETTTVHWHGAHVPAAQDGGTHNLIAVGGTLDNHFSLDQPGASLWYHPHPDGRTGAQVYAGLAGLLLVDDGEDAKLGLPTRYGIDDLPIILQDRKITASGELDYMPTMMDAMGMKGDHLLVNGRERPFVQVPAGWVRLRVLNGSNARLYTLGFADDRRFHVIAGDASLLAAPVAMTRLLLAPAERVELMVDVSNDSGKTLELMNYGLKGMDRLSSMAMDFDAIDAHASGLMQLRIGAADGKGGTLPAHLIDLPEPLSTTTKRRFTLDDRMGGMMGGGMGGMAGMAKMGGMGGMAKGMFLINGQSMDMNRIDVKVKLGTTEIWEISNTAHMAHPFHFHGTSFRILSRNGAPPPAHEQGFKDVVLVRQDETVQVVARFDQPADADHPFMFHCHILEHEDAGMMGQFTVA